MNDFPDLDLIAYKAERAASRRLARAAGLPADQALRRTLELAAGAQGLAALVAMRTGMLAAQAARDAARATEKAAADARRATRHDGPPSAWRGWFDGSAKPNPGRCGIGARLDGPGGIRVEIARPAGHGNSSEAEYRALIALLEVAVAHGARDLTVHGDSRVVIDDVAGPDLYAAPALAPYRNRVHALLAALSDVRLRWVPRHKNTDADALSQRALAALSFDESDADDALRTPS
ncbi:ribonuclease HI family protein [Massilia luteola]|uniref:ribonuclease HI family protein n=1 Tax=Massilia luteola TaxID=3081751 RepID=UPI002ACC190D|nr:ribonuclease HI family protein [Massilia sp. Gc5]